MDNVKNNVFSENQIKREYRKLLGSSRVYLSKDDVQLIRKAFEIIWDTCEKYPGNDYRKMLFDSVEVARIVSENMSLGMNSIVASLLYRFVEKNAFTRSRLQELFGDKTSELVNGLIKISRIDTKQTSAQAGNFRELLLTLATDVRVILIKIADRLFEIRNIEYLTQEEQIRISMECFNLYAPLAHRLGLYNIKTEMEDLSMKFTDPENYNLIEKKLKQSARRRNKLIREFLLPLEEQLQSQKLNYEVKSRTKSIYSIYRKMKNQNVDFEEVFDLFAVRFILNSRKKNEKADCWRVYSVVTDIYQPNPARLRDWISVPKSTGYESLHTTVMVPGGQWVEVQIRTKRMDEIAEKGLAAHWKYKGLKEENSLDEWLMRIREALETTSENTKEVIDNFKLNLYTNEIFVFTPRGDLKRYPKGATVLDFAFDIHTDVGSKCVGAKINGKNVPIRHVLNNGDKVEIITAKNQKPKQDWLEFVVSSKAKTKIRQTLKEEDYREALNGKEILKRRLKNWKIEYNDENVRKLLRQYKLKTSADLYYLISTGKIELSEIKENLTVRQEDTVKSTEPVPKVVAKVVKNEFEEVLGNELSKSEDFLVIDEKLNNVDYKLAKCCNPIFGDDIFGFVTVSEGIKIHRLSCPNAHQLIDRYGYRVVKARWKGDARLSYFETGIRVNGIDDLGIVSQISDIISKDLKVNMRSVSLNATDGLYEGIIKLLVKDKEHLEGLIKRLNRVKGIMSVNRVESY
ncbi:MAG: RelA/SpoT family protein [Bacteroidota bacterium]